MLTTPAEMSDEEHELHIKDAGRLMEQEMAAGNREAALGWMFVMQEAIRMRSATQIAKMEAERGLGEPCYFFEQGAADRLWLLERQAV